MLSDEWRLVLTVWFGASLVLLPITLGQRDPWWTAPIGAAVLLVGIWLLVVVVAGFYWLLGLL